MNYLKQSTAVDIAIGPFVDSLDGVTPETALSITQAECRLKKNAAAWAQKNEATTGTHEEEGWYEINLDATDTDALGILAVAVYVSGALPVWRFFQVLPAVVYDSLVAGTDLLQVDLQQIGGDAASAADLKDFADAGYDPATNKVQGVVLADTVTTYTGNTPQTGDNYAIVNSGVHGNAAIMTLLDAIGAYVDTEVAAIKAKTDNLPTDPADESQIQAAIADLKTYVDTEVAAILAAVDTEVAAIKAKTDNLPASPAAVSDVPTVAAISDGVWDEATAGHSTAGSTGKALTDAGGASDPWATPLPGAYDAGEAGYILGTNLDQKISEIIGGPSVPIVVGSVSCASVQYFDIGEIKPVGASLESTGGTITLSAVTVTLEDADGVAMYGIEDVDATDFDTGGVTSASAYYKLYTIDPPDDGPIAAGTYRMVFTFVGTTSDTVERTYEVPITIKVS